VYATQLQSHKRCLLLIDKERAKDKVRHTVGRPFMCRHMVAIKITFSSQVTQCKYLKFKSVLP
jgi:hypothetical protein